MHSSETSIFAPMRRRSFTYPKRSSYTVSWIVETPRAAIIRIASGCCQSVINPGCGAVATSVARYASAPEKTRASASCDTPAPIAFTFSTKAPRSSALAPTMRTCPRVASAATANETASLRSGSTRCTAPVRRGTPRIVITRAAESHAILAPMP